MEKELLDLIKWAPGVLATLAGLGSLYVTYRFGRRSKIDEIHIRKRHEMAEELAALLTEDFHERTILAELYQKNFGHVRHFSEAAEEFAKYETLYSGMRELMGQLPTGVNQLEKLVRRSSVYFDEELVPTWSGTFSLPVSPTPATEREECFSVHTSNRSTITFSTRVKPPSASDFINELCLHSGKHCDDTGRTLCTRLSGTDAVASNS